VTCIRLLEMRSAFGFPKRGASGDGSRDQRAPESKMWIWRRERSSNHRSELCYRMLCTVAKIEVKTEKELSRYF
jgi:hypothetical protein